MSKGISLKITVSIIFFLLIGYVSILAVEDGFGLAQKIESRHFIIYYTEGGLDLAVLSQQLNMGLSDKLIAGRQAKGKASGQAGLADMLDTLFAQVSDMLDMHLYSYKANIKICKDYNQMNQIYRNLFNNNLNTPSFYAQELNTIYVSGDNFRRNILGHEIAHAIISHYFVVAPPPKIHEILSMYVEYQLRKAEE